MGKTGEREEKEQMIQLFYNLKRIKRLFSDGHFQKFSNFKLLQEKVTA